MKHLQYIEPDVAISDRERVQSLAHGKSLSSEIFKCKKSDFFCSILSKYYNMHLDLLQNFQHFWPLLIFQNKEEERFKGFHYTKGSPVRKKQRLLNYSFLFTWIRNSEESRSTFYSLPIKYCNEQCCYLANLLKV